MADEQTTTPAKTPPKTQAAKKPAAATGKQSMTPAMAKKLGLDPTPYGTGK
ncbi:hypothetical protein [Roseivivax isoporae]|nr:hypothetical protein [Roseivivax isoporae]